MDVVLGGSMVEYLRVVIRCFFVSDIGGSAYDLPTETSGNL